VQLVFRQGGGAGRGTCGWGADGAAKWAVAEDVDFGLEIGSGVYAAGDVDAEYPAGFAARIEVGGYYAGRDDGAAESGGTAASGATAAGGSATGGAAGLAVMAISLAEWVR